MDSPFCERDEIRFNAHLHTHTHKFQIRFTLENSLKSPFTFYGKQLRIIHIRRLLRMIVYQNHLLWWEYDGVQCIPFYTNDFFYLICSKNAKEPHKVVDHFIANTLHPFSLSLSPPTMLSHDLSLFQFIHYRSPIFSICISEIKTMFFIQSGWLYQALGLYLT